MADSKYLTRSNESTEAELTIRIWPYEQVQFRGCMAQLIAAGIVPDGVDMPEGKAAAVWGDSRFEYCLHRVRPDGMKGSAKLWIGGDYWSVQRRKKGYSTADFAIGRISEKKRELEAEIWRHTPAGIAQVNAWVRSRADRDFQLFLNSVLPPKRMGRGRPTKTEAQAAAGA